MLVLRAAVLQEDVKPRDVLLVDNPTVLLDEDEDALDDDVRPNEVELVDKPIVEDDEVDCELTEDNDCELAVD